MLRPRCCCAQVRTWLVPRAATSARRAPGGSRPRRRAAPQWPPRARPRRRLFGGPTLPSRGAASTTPAAMRTSTPTRSAPATLTTSCCAPPLSPPVRRCRTARGTHMVLIRYSKGTQRDSRNGTERVLKGYSQGTQERLTVYSRTGTHSGGETASGACGCACGILVGSVVQWCARSEHGSI